MVSKRIGTPQEIATQGLSSVDGVGIATQGFIEPILGDIILGGEAGVTFILGTYIGTGGMVTGGLASVSRALVVDANGGLVTGGVGLISVSKGYTATGGLVTGGAANVAISITPTVGGNVSIGGSAQISTLWNVIAQGGLIIDGAAITNVSLTVTPTGGITTGGAANVTYQAAGYIGSGGLVTGGEAIIDTNIDLGPIVFGRGGARIDTRKRPTFDKPRFDADDYLTPMDYLKRIQKIIDDADKKKLNQFKYIASGTLRVNGRGKIVSIKHDLPDSKVIIANNPPLTPIELDLPNVFSTGATAREIAELEDHLFLNDMLGRGDYKIKKGAKARFVHKKKTATGGTAEVKFVSGASKNTFFDMGDYRRKKEDDDFVLELNMRTRREQEEEDLRILGIID